MTSRQKLIWFALGVFSSGVISVLATAMLRRTELTHETVSYLVLEEPISRGSDQGDSDRAAIAYQTGAILRECGASYFEATASYEDQVPTADLPLSPGNLEALPCVVRRAQEQDVTIRTEIRWAGDRN